MAGLLHKSAPVYARCKKGHEILAPSLRCSFGGIVGEGGGVIAFPGIVPKVVGDIRMTA
jgi:hypothetical protein